MGSDETERPDLALLWRAVGGSNSDLEAGVLQHVKRRDGGTWCFRVRTTSAAETVEDVILAIDEPRTTRAYPGPEKETQ